MDLKALGIMAVLIGFLFWTTLQQARELGAQDGQISMLKASAEFVEKINEIKEMHQTELDVKDMKNAVEVQGLKNDIIDQAADFETKGLSDPIGLSDDNTEFINDFMRRNSRDNESTTGDTPSDGPVATGIPPDRDIDNQP